MPAGPEEPRTCAVSTGFSTNYGRNHKVTGVQTPERSGPAMASFNPQSRIHKSQHPMDPTENGAHLGAGALTQASGICASRRYLSTCHALLLGNHTEPEGFSNSAPSGVLFWRTACLTGRGRAGANPAPHSTPGPAALPLVSHNDHQRALRGPDTRHSQHGSPSLCSP